MPVTAEIFDRFETTTPMEQSPGVQGPPDAEDGMQAHAPPPPPPPASAADHELDEQVVRAGLWEQEREMLEVVHHG